MLKLHYDPQLDPRSKCGASIIISLYIYYDMHAKIIFIIIM